MVSFLGTSTLHSMKAVLRLIARSARVGAGRDSARGVLGDVTFDSRENDWERGYQSKPGLAHSWTLTHKNNGRFPFDNKFSFNQSFNLLTAKRGRGYSTNPSQKLMYKTHDNIRYY